VDPAQNAKLQMLHQCWAGGQWERMEMLGRELLVPTPSDADLLSAVGVAVFQLDRRDEARRFFEEAIVNEPDHAPSHSMMGCRLDASCSFSETFALRRPALREP
jgi:hypothetical protein